MQSASTQQTPIVLLGSGYTGRVVAALARKKGLPILLSSRSPGEHLSFVPEAQRLEFDLDRPVTWQNVPFNSDLIWCFPARPIERVEALAQQTLAGSRLVVLGSTSAYSLGSSESPTLEDGRLDESSPINRTLPRVQGEEYLRLDHRAVVLRVAGIYGPGRNPLDWIRRGRITNLNRSVNLIHVQDLAAACLLALERGRPGEVYNVSDGVPRRWGEICAVAQQRWGVPPPPAVAGDPTGKRLSNTKLLRELGYVLRYPDLYAALDELERLP